MAKILMMLSNPLIIDPRVYNEAKALVDLGNEVSVVVWDKRGEYESESYFDGIRVIRVHNKGFMEILPNDLLRVFFWWFKAFKKGLDFYKKDNKLNIIHCHNLDTLEVGIWLKKKTGCKLVYDAHEIFGYMIEGHVPKFVVNFVFKLEKTLVKHVDHIITVNEQLNNYFKKITRVPISIVMNCKDLPFAEYKPPENKIFTVTFIGGLHRGRLFPDIVDALGEVDKIKFVIAARKENMELYREVESRVAKYKNVEFLGQIPFNQVIPQTCMANVIIQPIDSTQNTAKVSTPNKLFEALACGRPIISTRGTNPGNLVQELQCGLAVNYNVESFKEGVVRLRDDPILCNKFGKNGFMAAKEKYNWENQKRNLLEVYENIIE